MFGARKELNGPAKTLLQTCMCADSASNFLGFLLLALFVLSSPDGHAACEQAGTKDMDPASLQ